MDYSHKVQETRKVVEVIPYRNFKEKIQITKKYDGKAAIEIYKGYIYIERVVKQ